MYLYDAIPSKDGGIVFTGGASSIGSGDFPDTLYGGVFVGKIDSNHNLLWLHVYGGHHAQAICQTNDGGYAILAYAMGINGYVTGYHGNGDMWLMKIDSFGNYQWGNCYGSGGGDEQPLSIANTRDNGLIMFGISNGSGGDVPYHLGPDEFDYDWLVVKTDSLGNKQWVRDLGGSDDEDSYGSIVVADTGYYIFGSSASKDGNCIDTGWHSRVHTNYDYYVLKLNDSGVVCWAKSFGGRGVDRAGEAKSAIWDSSDSTIVATGLSTSTDFMVTGDSAGACMWAIKVDKSGRLVWQKALGGMHGCRGTSITKQGSGNYMCLGYTSGLLGGADVQIIQINKNGDRIGDTIFGGTDDEVGAVVFPYHQGIIVAGGSYSNSFTEGYNYGRRGTGDECFISYLSNIPNPNSISNPNSINYSLFIYPNPANKEVNIETKCAGKLAISNSIGQIVFIAEIKEENRRISVDNWIPGIYIVHWQGIDGQMITNKLIIN